MPTGVSLPTKEDIMPTVSRRPASETASPKARENRLYLAIGGIVIALLIGVYVAIGTPGLHTQIASAPVPADTSISR
jgi:hypothetical protein